MRSTLLLLMFAVFLKSGAQRRYDDELQLTETRFALESQIHGLKWGFLHNMDTSALGINKEGFISLYKVWQDRPDQSSFLLQWKPTALWWSEDGLFGLTTGPFFTQPKKDSSALATGYFFTIWQRPQTGVPFRFVVDAGVQMDKAKAASAFVGVAVTKDVIPSEAKAKKSNVVLTGTKSPKQAFGEIAAQQSLQQAVSSFAGEHSLLLFSGYGKVEKSELNKVSDLSLRYHFLPAGTKGLSSGCYYEWGQLREESSSKADPVTGYYVQVWQSSGKEPRLLAAVYHFYQDQK